MVGQIQLGALSIDRRPERAPFRVKQDKPAYGVGGKGFYDDKDRFWNPGEALYWEKEPNMDLTPLNKLAYDEMQKFLDKLDAYGQKKAKKEGKEYSPAAREAWVQDLDISELPSPQNLMGAPAEGKNEAVR